MSLVTESQKRYEALRNKLTALHYFQPLGYDSCALVEKLLGDVLKSVENFEILAKRYDQNAKALQEEKRCLAFLKSQNERLQSKNNRLQTTGDSGNGSLGSRFEGSQTLLLDEYKSSTNDLLQKNANSDTDALKNDNDVTITQREPKQNNSFVDESNNKEIIHQQVAILREELQAKQQELNKVTRELEIKTTRVRQIEKENESLKTRMHHLESDSSELNSKHQALLEMKRDNENLLSQLETLRRQVLTAKVTENTDDLLGSKENPKHTDILQREHSSNTLESTNATQQLLTHDDATDSFQPNSNKLTLQRNSIAEARNYMLEKTLRAERSRCHRLGVRVHQLETELDEHLQTIQRLEALQANQRRKNRYLHSVSPLKKASTVALPSTMLNKQDSGNKKQNSDWCEAEFNPFPVPKPTPISDDIDLTGEKKEISPYFIRSTEKNEKTTDTSTTHFSTCGSLPSLLCNYFSSVSPLRAYSNSRALVDQNDIVSPFKVPPNKIPNGSATSNITSGICPDMLSTLHYGKLKNAEHISLSCQEALRAAIDSKEQLRQNYALQEASTNALHENHSKRVASLKIQNELLQQSVQDLTIQIQTQETEIEAKTEFITVLECRIDLLGRRVVELTKSMNEMENDQKEERLSTEQAKKNNEKNLSTMRSSISNLRSKLELTTDANIRLGREVARLQADLQRAVETNLKLQNINSHAQLAAESYEQNECMFKEAITRLHKELEETKRLNSSEPAEDINNNTTNVKENNTTQYDDKELLKRLETEHNRRLNAEQQYATLKQAVEDMSVQVEASAKSASKQHNILLHLKKENKNLKGQLLMVEEEKKTVQENDLLKKEKSEKRIQGPLLCLAFMQPNTVTSTCIMTDIVDNNNENKITTLKTSLRKSKETSSLLEARLARMETKLNNQRLAFDALQNLCTSLKERLQLTSESRCHSAESSSSISNHQPPLLHLSNTNLLSLSSSMTSYETTYHHKDNNAILNSDSFNNKDNSDCNPLSETKNLAKEEVQNATSILNCEIINPTNDTSHILLGTHEAKELVSLLVDDTVVINKHDALLALDNSNLSNSPTTPRPLLRQ